MQQTNNTEEFPTKVRERMDFKAPSLMLAHAYMHDVINVRQCADAVILLQQRGQQTNITSQIMYHILSMLTMTKTQCPKLAKEMKSQPVS